MLDAEKIRKLQTLIAWEPRAESSPDFWYPTVCWGTRPVQVVYGASDLALLAKLRYFCMRFNRGKL